MWGRISLRRSWGNYSGFRIKRIESNPFLSQSAVVLLRRISMENPFSSKPGVRTFLAAGCMVLACLGLLLMSGYTAATTPQKAHARAADPNTGLRTMTYYYVSTDGNDDDPGTEAQPWRTIQKAAETLVAGDTVYIKAGTYQERVIPQNSGSAGNYIVYAAYPGHTVTIDGASIIVPEWGGLFEIVDKSYIRVSGLRIMNAGPNLHNPGILVDESSHIIIEKNYIYHTSDSGIGVWSSDDVIVDNNEVELACYNGYNESISVGEEQSRSPQPKGRNRRQGRLFQWKSFQ
jgi:parallel beta-helix repeat protein